MPHTPEDSKGMQFIQNFLKSGRIGEQTIPGTDLAIRATDRHIRILSRKGKFFLASVSPEGTGSFAIKTRDGARNRPHPHLFASRLMGLALDFFGQHGTPVARIEDVWNSPGLVNTLGSIHAVTKNYTGYMRHRPENASIEAMRQAAANTHEARTLARHGFEVAGVSEEINQRFKVVQSVRVTFKKRT